MIRLKVSVIIKLMIMAIIVWGVSAFLWNDFQMKSDALPSYTYYACFTLVYMLIVLFIFMFLKKKILVNYIWFSQITGLVLTLLLYSLVECVNNNILSINLWGIVTNGIPILFIYNLLLVIFQSVKISTTITSSFFLCFAIINHFVYEFRQRPILPWDIKAAGTAATVANSYEFECTIEIIFSVLCIIAFITCIQAFSHEKICFKSKKVIYHIMLCVCLFYVYKLGVIHKVERNTWDINNNYRTEGQIASFLSYYEHLDYEKPSGYNKKKCEELLSRQEVISSEFLEAKNIIVIMNESFADLRIVGEDGQQDEYMPFIDSLNDNTVKGNLYVPSFATGTSNVEFEVLTGASCAYVPGTPYQTIITSDLNVLTSHFDSNYFLKIAFHPYIAENYNRHSVYSHFGFDKYLSWSDMRDYTMVRWCVSDASDYDTIINEYENKETEGLFLFNVTMQNHGSYEGEYDNFQTTVDLSKYGDFHEAENYLGMIQESDRALQKLISYFEKVDEPTLICFFGDHQPNIETEYYEMMYGKSMDAMTQKEKLQMYITPFLIWANYDIDEQHVDKLSSNYLCTLILKYAGQDLSEYEAFLYRLYQEYPVISPVGVYDSYGKFYKSVEEVDDELLEQYEMLQYYRLQGN